MELRTLVELIGRHKWVAIAGTATAVLLAILSAARVDVSKFPPLERRSGPDYVSDVRVFITQPGFPWGRSTLNYSSENGGPPVLQGDPDRFAGLAVLYSRIANSQAILGRVRLDGERFVDLRDAKLVTRVLTTNDFSSTPLPLIDIVATYTTKAGAEELARQMTAALSAFIVQGQRRAQIPARDRVVLQIIDGAQSARPVGGISMTLPLLILLTGLVITVGTMLVLGNLALTKPQVTVSDESEAQQPVGAAITEMPRKVAPEALITQPDRRRSSPPVSERLGPVARTSESAGDHR